MSSEYNLFGDWEDSVGGEEIKILDEWFQGDVWKNVVVWAERGDHDSLELMESVNILLGSLVFHLQNESPESRINYEIDQFRQLIDTYK